MTKEERDKTYDEWLKLSLENQKEYKVQLEKMGRFWDKMDKFLDREERMACSTKCDLQIPDFQDPH